MPIHSNDNQKKLWLSCGILRGWHGKSFTEYSNDVRAKEKVLSYLSQHSKAIKCGTGLYLYGANGVGKTHLAMCLLKEFISLRYNCRAISMTTLIDTLSQSWGHDQDSKDLLRAVKTCTILLLEEPGKELKKGSNTLALNVLDSTLRYRCQSMLPTIITSNEPPGDISSLYSEDVASMLREMCIPVLVKGADWRGTILDKNKMDFGI